MSQHLAAQHLHLAVHQLPHLVVHLHQLLAVHLLLHLVVHKLHQLLAVHLLLLLAAILVILAASPSDKVCSLACELAELHASAASLNLAVHQPLLQLLAVAP